MNYSDASMAPLMNLIGAAIALLIPVLIISIIYCCAFWKLFTKAGKAGWKSIIPFYNNWVLVEIAELDWWWFLLILSPWILAFVGLGSIASIISSFAMFNCYYNIARKFNNDTGFSVCAGLFSFIFTFILAFSKKQVYNVNIPVSKNGVFGASDTNNYEYDNNNYRGNNMNQSTNTVDRSNEGTNNFDHEFSFCSNCGTKLNKDIRFCPNCGKEKI